jgi:hypothetical protein
MYRHTKILYTPPDDTKLWRYTDLSQFLWLLSRHSLYFAHLSKFDDHWEGAIPAGSIEGLIRAYTSGAQKHALSGEIPDSATLNPNALKYFKWFLKSLQANYGVSCWHLNDVESVAMWKLYVRGNDGVAIQTTVGRLKACLSHDPRNIFISRVNYLDHETLPMEELISPHALIPIVTKRRSFLHESEVRVILDRRRAKEGEEEELRQKLSGEAISVDISKLIERIVASPDYPGWAIANLQEIVALAGLDVRVETSDLLRRPELPKVPRIGRDDEGEDDDLDLGIPLGQ